MRMMLDAVFRLFGAAALMTVVVVGGGPLPAAHAVSPLGACCLQGRSCEDLTELQCDDSNGTFIGAGTSCATADCQAQVGAPLLSIFGLVAAAGALGGLGVYRLLFRPRRP